MKFMSYVFALCFLGLGMSGVAGLPVSSTPADIAKVPDAAPLMFRPSDKPADAKLPLFVYLHCKNSSPAESAPFFKPLVDSWKCALLLPCGSTKLGIKEGGMPVYDWNGNVDETTIVNNIKAARGVNPKAVFLIGFSAGAFMAYQVALKHPDVFTGVIVMNGDIPLKNLDEAAIRSATPKIPFFLAHGTNDWFSPPARGQKALDYLKANGFPAMMKTHGGEHALPDDVLGIIKEGVDWISTSPAIAPVPAGTGPIFMRPAGMAPDRKTALIVFMHGSGSSPEDCEKVFAPLVEAWQCSVLYPRGSKVMGAPAGRRPGHDWDAAKDVDRVIETIRSLKGVDPRRVILTGFSSGAFMCYRVAFREPGMFVGVVPFSGAMPGDLLAATTVPVVSPKVPFFLVNGEKDKAVTLESARTAEAYLKKAGLPVKLHAYDGAHFFPEDVFDVLKDAIDWFDKGR